MRKLFSILSLISICNFSQAKLSGPALAEVIDAGGFTMDYFVDNYDGRRHDWPDAWGGKWEDFTEDDVIIRLNSMDAYLKYFDLERIHISQTEDGSTAAFLAVPNLAVTEDDSPAYLAAVKAAAEKAAADATAAGKTPEEIGQAASLAAAMTKPSSAAPAVGYFFTNGSGGNLDFVPFNEPVKIGETGSGAGYPCGVYQDAGVSGYVQTNHSEYLKAQLDYKNFNRPYVEDLIAKDAPAAQVLNMVARGFRMTAMMENELGPVSTNCTRLDSGSYNPANPYHFQSGGAYGGSSKTGYEFSWLPYAFVAPGWGGDWVQTFAIFKNYKKGDLFKKKADVINVYGPSFGGHFVWTRAGDGVVMKNSDWMIDQYNAYCKESGKCNGYVKCDGSKCESTMK